MYNYKLSHKGKLQLLTIGIKNIYKHFYLRIINQGN